MVESAPARVSLSVVIPARNEAERLPRVLPAVREAARRAGREVEVVVADHESSDDTARIARLHGALVVSAAGAKTIAGVRNRGAAAARGDVLAFLDADCVVDPGWLEAAFAVFADPAVGAAGLPPRAEAGGPWTARASALVACPRPLVTRETARWLPSANLLVRRAAFEKVGGFDASLVTCEDYDLTVRIAADGWRLVKDPGLGALHLREPLSVGQLFRKERWRGLASVEGVRRHGLELGELPSLAIPAWHVLFTLLLPVGFLAAGPEGLVAALALLFLPTLLRTARVVWKAGRPLAAGELLAFWAVYDAARATALVSELGSLSRDHGAAAGRGAQRSTEGRVQA